MSKVEPGCMARIVYDPDQSDGHSNVGKQVYVKEWVEPTTRTKAEFLRRFGAAVLVEPLEPTWGGDFGAVAYRTLSMKPAGVPVSMLQRIDPPPDSLDLLRTEPLPGEHRSMEDLAIYIKEHS